MTLHIAYAHASVNPTLFLVLHRGLRYAAFRFCCGFVYDQIRSLTMPPVSTDESPQGDEMDFVVEVPQANLLMPPPPPPVAHQQPVVAQINSSIRSTPSPYHRCVIQVKFFQYIRIIITCIKISFEEIKKWECFGLMSNFEIKSSRDNKISSVGWFFDYF